MKGVVRETPETKRKENGASVTLYLRSYLQWRKGGRLWYKTVRGVWSQINLGLHCGSTVLCVALTKSLHFSEPGLLIRKMQTIIVPIS